GTLTDGGIYYSTRGEYKKFHVKDGLALILVKKIGIKTMFITKRKSKIVKRRAKELNVDKVIQNANNKAELLLKEIPRMSISFTEILYIGDDLNDIESMKLCGFAACPADAVNSIIKVCDYISPYKGGDGAVRDIIEHFLKQTNQWTEITSL
ncbi:MAG: HAD hydrolase family protein, partial [Bacilli bacterium]